MTSGIAWTSASKCLEAVGRVAIHRDVDQRHQRQAELARIEQGAVTGDDAGLLQRTHAAQTGRRRQADAVGQILIADAAVVLEYLENLAVVAVKFHGCALK